MPASSTGTPTTSSPAAVATGQASSFAEGSSTASRRAPARASTCSSSVTPWAYPLQISMFCGTAEVPRTRLR
jgi:hypothetical protein